MNKNIAAIQARRSAIISGDLEYGRIGPLTFDEMRKEYAETLKATLDHFGGDFSSYVYVAVLRGSNIKACITGISPNSPAYADFFAHAPADIDFLLAEVSRLQAVIEETQ